jgi:hypothetical protein
MLPRGHGCLLSGVQDRFGSSTFTMTTRPLPTADAFLHTSWHSTIKFCVVWRIEKHRHHQEKAKATFG